MSACSRSFTQHRRRSRKAAAHGIALVSVTDAWMSGRSAHYVEMIAKASLVAIHTAASSRLVAPPGGVRPMLRHQSDRHCSAVVARADRARHGHLGLHDDRGDAAASGWESCFPKNVALGPDGKPTRDRLGTARRLAAFRRLQGFRAGADDAGTGGARGAGSDAESDYGYLFIAFRPDLLGPADIFEQHVTQLVERIQGDAAASPASRRSAFRPNGRFALRRRALREGLEIDRLVFDALVALRAGAR